MRNIEMKKDNLMDLLHVVQLSAAKLFKHKHTQGNFSIALRYNTSTSL